MSDDDGKQYLPVLHSCYQFHNDHSHNDHSHSYHDGCDIMMAGPPGG